MFDRVQTGNRIWEIREQHHLTQKELAEKLGCTTKHVSQVERGFASFSYELMSDFCDLFGVSMDFLVRGLRDSAPLLAQIPTVVLEIWENEDTAMQRRLLDYLSMFPPAGYKKKEKAEEKAGSN